MPRTVLTFEQKQERIPSLRGEDRHYWEEKPQNYETIEKPSWPLPELPTNLGNLVHHLVKMTLRFEDTLTEMVWEIQFTVSVAPLPQETLISRGKKMLSGKVWHQASAETRGKLQVSQSSAGRESKQDAREDAGHTASRTRCVPGRRHSPLTIYSHFIAMSASMFKGQKDLPFG